MSIVITSMSHVFDELIYNLIDIDINIDIELYRYTGFSTFSITLQRKYNTYITLLALITKNGKQPLENKQINDKNKIHLNLLLKFNCVSLFPLLVAVKQKSVICTRFVLFNSDVSS